jgi:DNA-binding MarR family transcriptional regulator
MGKPEISEIAECQHCACSNLRKAARSITQIYDSALQPLDLRATQFTVLAVARVRGNLSISELAEQMVMDRTTLTRNLKPLEKRGLIRIGSGADRRTRMVSVTREGKELLSHAFPIWREVQHRLVERFGTHRFESLLGDLNDFVRTR